MHPKLLFVCLAAITVCSWAHGLNQIEISCKSKFKNIDTVGQMLNVVEELRLYRDSRVTEKASKPVQRCMDEFDSINELGNLLQYRDDVCHPEYVEQLLAYCRQFIRHTIWQDLTHPLHTSKLMVRHFVRRYLMHVSAKCRLNAVPNLKQVEQEFTDQDWARVLPWRVKPEAVESSVSTPENSSTSETKEAEITDEKNSTKAEDVQLQQGMIQLIESITTLDHLTGILPIGVDAITSAPQVRLSLGENELEGSILDAQVTNDPRLGMTIEACDKFAYYYEGAILSPVRLANAGFQWQGHKLASLHALNETEIGDWMRVANTCYSIRKFKTSFALTSEQKSIDTEVYHRFEHFNSIGLNEQLVGSTDIRKFAMSRTEMSFVRYQRRFVHLLRKKLSCLSKSSKGNKAASKAAQMLLYLDMQNGDRASNFHLSSKAFVLLVIGGLVTLVIGAIVAGVLLGIYLPHHHGGATTAGYYAYHGLRG